MIQSGNWFDLLLPYVLLFAVFYVLFILPQRRKEKKVKDMLNSIKTGDNIVTIGGIIGKIASIKDDELLIETAQEKTRIKVAKWAVKSVDRPNEKK